MQVALIKFKNIHNPSDHDFNVFLRNRTAYLIDYRYVVPMEFVEFPEEQWDIHKYISLGRPIWDTVADPSLTEYIDLKETEHLNNIYPFGPKEPGPEVRFYPHRQIPLSELKHFRTWLATSIDVFTNKNEEVLKHILHYYMHGMNDDTIKWLSIFGDGTESKPNPIKKGCGCGGDTSTSDNIFICNSIDQYRKGIYNGMVSKFSLAQFWALMPESFLVQMKLRIEGILRSGLIVDVLTSSYTSVYALCGCDKDGVKKENEIYYRGILERLIASLNYIIRKDATGHINFISKALKEFASLLYEKMEW